jgi:hypothetical protein
MSNVLVSYLPAVSLAIDAAAAKALKSAGNVGRNQIVKNLSGSRSGRSYRVPETQRYYTASAPGEYPAWRLGDLAGSYKVKQVKKDEVLIGSDKDHALALEKKPPNKGGREHCRPSLNQATPAMLAELAKRWF